MLMLLSCLSRSVVYVTILLGIANVNELVTHKRKKKSQWLFFCVDVSIFKRSFLDQSSGLEY